MFLCARRFVHPRLMAAVAAVLALAAVALLRPADASALTGKQPIVVVLCKFKDKTDEPQSASYYQNMFSETGVNSGGVFDYWRDVSYSQLDLTGTIVKGWYELTQTRAEWNALTRNQKIDTCATQADADVDFTKFAGVVVLTNQVNLQEDLFGGCCGFLINGTVYNIGAMDSEWDQQYNGILHESGHLFRFNHSRTLSQQTNQDDYGDQWDVMSCLGCFGTTTTFGRNTTTGAGPGVNVVQMDTAGWVAANRKLTDFSTSSCNQRTVQLAALNHPEASGYLDAQIPASIFIQKIGTSTTTDHYSLELREKSGWDAGIPQHAVLVHLHGQDNYSYLVDQSGLAGTYYTANFSNDMAAGDAYVDAPRKAYVAVNSISGAAHQATLTIGACKIDTATSGVGPASGDFGDTVTLTADLKVNGSNAPIPAQTVALTLGTQSCNARTDTAGHGTCQITLNQHSGSYTLTASFATVPVYNSSNASAGFTINKEDTQLAYTGATTSDYHDAFTASARLTEPDGPVAGKTVTFELGTGDTCSATTNGSGDASCSIVPTQAAGASTIKASFAGDDDYKLSNASKAFTITREQTTTAYTGPTVVLQGASGVTLKGRLLEDGVTPIAGRTLTLKVGSQSCTGTTASDGVATCKVTFTGALGSASLSAAFAGDAFYLPSSDTAKTATVFSFPSRGAFVLGDRTVATATAATTVTWWADTWAARNALSGGTAPSSFKGFAGTVPLPTSTPPAACGGRWTTGPGNSPPPTSGVPSYMGV